MRILLFITTILLCSFSLGAQNFQMDSIPSFKGIYERKLIFGIYNDIGMSTVSNAGSDSIKRKAKPSLAGGIKVEYYPLKWLGLSLGLGVQQRGCVYTIPVSGSQADSLNQAVKNIPQATDARIDNRLKLSGMEIPIMIHLRTPKEITRNMRLSAAIGVMPVYNFRMVYATAAANEVTANLSHSIIPWDLNYTVSVGPEINIGNASIIRMHVFGKWGTVNSYKNVAQNSGFSGFTGGKNSYYGCSLSLLFR
jgi:hypothetical protein